MPLFDYKCTVCGNVFDEFVKNEKETVVCPKCKGETERYYVGKCNAIKGSSCSGNCKTCGGCKS